MQIIFSLAGVLALLACAYALSDSRRDINWRTVIGAFSLQAGFAALVLYFPLGQSMLGSISNGVSGLLSFADEQTKASGLFLANSQRAISSSQFAYSLLSFSSPLSSQCSTTWA